MSGAARPARGDEGLQVIADATDVADVEAVLATLRGHAGSPHVICLACGALHCLVSSLRQKMKMTASMMVLTHHRQMIADAVKLLVAVLQEHQEHEHVQNCGREALETLVVDDRKAFIALVNDEGHTLTRGGNVGAIENVVAFVAQPACHTYGELENLHVQEEAISLLLVLINSSLEHTAQAKQAGAVEAVLMAMRARSESLTVQSKGCRILSLLASRSSETNTQIGYSGVAVELIVDAMRGHAGNLEFQGLACNTLFVLTKENRQAATRAGNAGAVEAVLAVLRRHSESVSQYQACRFLTCLAADDAEKIKAGNAGAIELMVAVLRGHVADADFQEVACAALRALITGNRAHKIRAEKAGAIETLIATMRMHAENSRLQREVSTCLYQLVMFNINETTGRLPELQAIIENRRQAGRKGAVQAVVSALLGHTANEEVQIEALTALVVLMSGNVKNRIRAGKAGAVAAVIEAMRAHSGSAGVQEQACRALRNLRSRTAKHMTQAGRAGAVELVVEAMRAHTGSAGSGVQEQACGALRSLTGGIAENVIRAGKAGAVELVVETMRAHTDLPECDFVYVELQGRACGALRNLTSCNAENITRAVKAGAIEAVVRAMDEAFEICYLVVLERACGVLRNLTSSVAETVAENMTRARHAGAIEMVVSALDRDDVDENEEFQVTQACAALCNLTGGNEESITLAVVKCNAIEALVQAMRRYADSAEVQESACLTLFFFTQGNNRHAISRRARAVHAGAAVVAEAALRAHDSSTLVSEALDLLLQLRA
jgi:hypothetical protein